MSRNKNCATSSFVAQLKMSRSIIPSANVLEQRFLDQSRTIAREGLRIPMRSRHVIMTTGWDGAERRSSTGSPSPLRSPRCLSVNGTPTLDDSRP